MGDGVSHRDKPEKSRVYFQWFEFDDVTAFPGKFQALGDAITWGLAYVSSGCLAPELLKSKLWRRDGYNWKEAGYTLQMLDEVRKNNPMLPKGREDELNRHLHVNIEATFAASAMCIVKGCGAMAYNKGSTEEEARENILKVIESNGWVIRRGLVFCKDHG